MCATVQSAAEEMRTLHAAQESALSHLSMRPLPVGEKDKHTYLENLKKSEVRDAYINARAMRLKGSDVLDASTNARAMHLKGNGVKYASTECVRCV